MKIVIAAAVLAIGSAAAVPAFAEDKPDAPAQATQNAAESPNDSKAPDDQTDLEKDFADQDFKLPDDRDLDEDMGKGDRDFFDNDDTDDDSDDPQ